MKYGNYVYDPKKKRWINQVTGQTALLGNRLKTKDGDYIQLNSNGTVTKVGSVSGGLSKEYIALKKKLGQAIDVQSEDTAMRQGLIKDRRSGKWRLDTEDKRQTKTINGRKYYLRNIGNGKGVWTNFDTGLSISQDRDKIQKAINKRVLNLSNQKKDKSVVDNIKESGVVTGLIDSGLDKLGVDNEIARFGINALGNLAYSIPGVGTVLSVADAAALAANGKYGDAATAIGFGLIPFGKSLKTINQLRKVSKLGKAKAVLTKPLPKRFQTNGQSIYKTERAKGLSPEAIRVKYRTLSLQDYLGKKIGNAITGDKVIRLNDKNIKAVKRTARALQFGGIGASFVQNLQRGAQQAQQYRDQATQEQDLLQQRINQQDIDSGVWFGRSDLTNINSDYPEAKFTPEVLQGIRRYAAYEADPIKNLFE